MKNIKLFENFDKSSVDKETIKEILYPLTDEYAEVYITDYPDESFILTIKNLETLPRTGHT